MCLSMHVHQKGPTVTQPHPHHSIYNMWKTWTEHSVWLVLMLNVDVQQVQQRSARFSQKTATL